MNYDLSTLGLSEEELKAVFADMKKQAKEDPILQAMMKAREAELKYKAQQEMENKENFTKTYFRTKNTSKEEKSTKPLYHFRPI